MFIALFSAQVILFFRSLRELIESEDQRNEPNETLSLRTASPTVFEPWFSRGPEGECRGRDLGSFFLKAMGPRCNTPPPSEKRHEGDEKRVENKDLRRAQGSWETALESILGGLANSLEGIDWETARWIGACSERSSVTGSNSSGKTRYRSGSLEVHKD